MPLGQRCWRTSAKHLASSSSPERLTRSDAGITARAPCMMAAANQPPPLSHQNPRATATLPLNPPEANKSLDRKGFQAEGPLPPVLPTHVLGRGPDKVDPVALPGLHKLSGAHVGGINQMRARGQSLAGERGMNGAGAPGLVNAGRCGVDVDHQARGVRVAGLREMDHIARPAHLALGAKARLHIVGRLDAIRAATKLADRAKPRAPLSGGPAAAL